MTTDFIGSLVLGGLDFFTRRYFAFEKEVLSAVSRLYLGRFKPNWLKFWPKVGLASLLDCYSLEKSGYLLKKNGVLVVFLVLEKTGINKVIWRFY